jgi:phosphatidylethanolamine-binding protein (PEBP) family uncharacterized protein
VSRKASAVAGFSLSSSTVAPGGPIPRRHTCDGEDRSPPLSWSPPPAGTRSLALIVEGPDAPGGRFIHWLAWDIDPHAGGLAEGQAAPVVAATTSARSATAEPARPTATGATATGSGCMH